MDLVAEMLLDNLQRNHAETIDATRLAPALRRRFTRGGQTGGALFNADRLMNRLHDYPRWLRNKREEFDLFHIIDHSYAQLVHELPPERTVVTCHDLDTFRCLLNGEAERRSLLFRRMTKRIMSGLQRAARLTCDSVATRDELIFHQLVEPERAVVVPNGVHPSCSPHADAEADEKARRLMGNSREDAINLLHVGSTIQRKRLDVLLKVFSVVRQEFPGARLIRVGGLFTPAQASLIESLNLTEHIVVLPPLDRDVLAAIYRHAAVLLQPSEREGFGLPVIEALACGTPVIASDLPVLRETGGNAVSYCAVGDLPSWAETVSRLLLERSQNPAEWSRRRVEGIAQAAKFSWAEYAKKMVSVYQQLL